MKYLKLYEDNDWELTPENKEELLKKYTILLETGKSETSKFAIQLTSISVKDIFDNLDFYKKLETTIEDKKTQTENIKDKIYDIVENFYKEEIYSKLDEIAMDLDNITIELGELKDLLENMIYFAEKQKNNQIIFKVLKGESNYQINI